MNNSSLVGVKAVLSCSLCAIRCDEDERSGVIGLLSVRGTVESVGYDDSDGELT